MLIFWADIGDEDLVQSPDTGTRAEMSEYEVSMESDGRRSVATDASLNIPKSCVADSSDSDESCDVELVEAGNESKENVLRSNEDSLPDEKL
jgi:hypothetical protein